jgi:site-specific DNA-cytosine methylase
MWILPKNYQLSSAFAQDMVASKEDLTLPGLNIESSLMWRSKPSPLRTWLTRWKTDSYLPHLFTRILKPSLRTSFEAALISSLAATRASRFQQQGSDLAPKTQDTSGPTSLTTSMQFDLFDASSRTSKDTSAFGLREVIDDLEGAGYSATWGIFSAAEVGAPHQRKRVYILADSAGKFSERRIAEGVASWKPEEAIGDRSAFASVADAKSQRYGARREKRDIYQSDGGSVGECLSEPPLTGSCAGGDEIVANADRARQQTQRRESGAERETRLTGESGELANTSSQRFGGESQGQLQQPGRAEVVSAGEELADTISQRLEGLTRHGSDSSEPGRQSPQSQRPVSQSGVFSDTTGWLPEPRLGRVVDGCPDRVDRIRLLGNGVVPKTAARAWEILSSRLQKS